MDSVQAQEYPYQEYGKDIPACENNMQHSKNRNYVI